MSPPVRGHAGEGSAVADTDGTIYKNDGNREVLDLLPPDGKRILDVGCGAGDNARILTSRGCVVTGITSSEQEGRIAGPHLDRLVIADIESDDLPLEPGSFDAIVLSHVIEHVREPAVVLSKLAPLLANNGTLAIAVPNMANWRLRWRFLRGDWGRETTGPLDRTHLQFWSYSTAAHILDASPFDLVRRNPGQLAIPLWLLRRAAPRLCTILDRVIGRWFPNAFSGQVLLAARRVR
jgi:2-polyprenyl-3-methyl-5-hydroxy-6-metoxy-1,4-benzoquinol methylase